ncbi:hypothetical protein LZ578_12230 (plasmid) [Jeotgalibaca sp. MA1X17-3]|uniref:hypothetical protein n=1 Tax=Jeotgalibaca sp. MA1X17-3 TaxID=2908211 RepID=UPI001F22ED49|nr:hypothetical protein [Jeotgalibaca sp. MA1X17-3]UJF16747.1 hypothetical protein LZ578_12230 [Jeotgalibaca sp. MA1X17-3]
MVKITKEIYEQIKMDLPRIEESLSSKNGSQKLWRKLRSKYSILLPGLTDHVKESGKSAYHGSEFDYRPELEQLIEAILAYMIVNPVEQQSNEEINNEGSELLNQSLPRSIDEIINEKIEESKIYIRSKESKQKQIALEKIWDTFERLKTIYGKDKKKSINKLIDIVSKKSPVTKELLSKEFDELTKIGNAYHIRHFEIGKEPIHSDEFREYLYFRVLSLISYCLNEVNI